MKSIHHSDSGNRDSENHLFGHGVLGLSGTRKSPEKNLLPPAPWPLPPIALPALDF